MDTKKLDTGSRDAISFLPDEVLGNILSSLPTKEAASTSVLSKKWRNVFALVHNLDFDDSEFMHPEESDVIFRNFVDRTLALQCGSPIKKFALHCYCDDDSELAYVYRWICNAVERGVLELDVNIQGHLRVNLPCELFASKTLVKLTLGRKLYLGKLPSDVSLPSLKTLFIDMIFFEDDDLCGVLLAGCPMLEELSVVHHNRFPGRPLAISSLTVKRLSLDYHFDDRQYLSLNLPNLVYLDYSDYALCQYPQVNLDSLLEAKLDLYQRGNTQGLKSLFLGIRNVEILHLSPVSVDMINSYCRYELPVFNNLVKLSFGSKNQICWRLLPHLLKQSPKLETLIIQDLYGYTCDDVSMPQNKVKALHILDYQGTREEKLLKSFLGGFECLEVVQVDTNGRELQIKRDLKMLLGVSLPSKCHFKVT